MRVCLGGGGSGCAALLGFLMKLSWLLASSVMATLFSRVTALICSTPHAVAAHSNCNGASWGAGADSLLSVMKTASYELSPRPMQLYKILMQGSFAV